jgi:hypothetical protein
MTRIKIDDLKIDLDELKKKDPQILNKIRGGRYSAPVMLSSRRAGGGWGSQGSRGYPPGPDTMFCCTGKDSGCEPGPDTMFCCTGDDSGCHPFVE